MNHVFWNMKYWAVAVGLVKMGQGTFFRNWCLSWGQDVDNSHLEEAVVKDSVIIQAEVSRCTYAWKHTNEGNKKMELRMSGGDWQMWTLETPINWFLLSHIKKFPHYPKVNGNIEKSASPWLQQSAKNM